MKTVAIIQARMSSNRLPGKIMKELVGKPVIWHIIKRLKRCKEVDKIVVATPNKKEDQELQEYLKQNNIELFIYGGDENDLVSRFVECNKKYDGEIVVIINSDCPLIHPESVDRMVRALKKDKDADYVAFDTDTIEGGVATIRKKTLNKINKISKKGYQREHATITIIENPERFIISKITPENEFQNIKHRIWLDTEQDYKFLKEIYSRLYKDNNIVNLKQVIHLLKENPHLKEINSEIKGKDYYINNKIREYTESMKESNKENTKCNLCKMNQYRVLWKDLKRGYRVVICENCGLIFMNPRANQEASKQLYLEYHQYQPKDTILDEDGYFFKVADDKTYFLENIWKKRKPGRLLEIGSAYGHFLKIMNKKGWETYGVEPSTEEMKIAQNEFKLDNLYNNTFEDEQFPKEYFDVICSFHVLEHLRNPEAILKKSRELLKDDGLIYIDVPNAMELDVTILEELYLSSSQHIYQFTEETLRNILECNGFEVIEIKNHPIKPMYWGNLRVIAKKIKIIKKIDLKKDPEKINNVVRHMEEYYKKIIMLKERVKKIFYGLDEKNRKIVIYGGGLHTMALLDLLDFNDLNIKAIIDDDVDKQYKEIRGIKIFPFEKMKDINPEVILISSLGAEEKIYKKLKDFLPGMIKNKDVEIFKIYT